MANILNDSLSRTPTTLGMDVYRGTSFKFSPTWTPSTYYYNDDYIVDFVAYNGSLWACTRSHLSSTGTVPQAGSAY